MTEQQPKKVYELAKEMGMDSLSLLDKLKTLNIAVKNHMSELTGSDVEAAKSALAPPAPATKAKRTTTKSAPKAAAAPGTAPTPKVTAAKKKKKAEAAAPVVEAKDEVPAEKKAASPIIRRRVTGAEGTTTVSPTRSQPTETIVASETEAEVEYAAAPVDGAVPGTEELSTETLVTEQEMATEASTQQEAPVDAAPSETQAPGATPGATGAPGAKVFPPLPPRPVAPRKSFLKIVEPTVVAPRIVKPAPPAAPAARPTVKAPAAPGTENYRIIRMTKENLDQMVEEENAKKRGGGGREAEIKPEDVRFADYRKKEMVFLPKKKKLPIGKEIKKTKITTSKAQKRVVEINQTITVADLANQLSIKGVDVVRKLMGMGQMVNINSTLDYDTASLIASEYQYEARNVAFNEANLIAEAEAQAEGAQPEAMEHRPPIVTIMGHVDHGKTTLLDSIREANVAAGEAGGITQHIGAYTVDKNGKRITFIDTPGHEAFTVMRARGANVTDIVILVVAADDGVMPQTREALSHAQAAKVPIIVAVNKMDKPGANPERIRQALAELNLLAEDWGGETQFVHVSAIKKEGIDQLLEAILLQAEILDLKANPTGVASGTVLEARLERGRGAVISVLVRKGTLRVGDPIVSGKYSGKVKALQDDRGRPVEEAPPGIAVEVLGFEGVASAGDTFTVTKTEADARDIAEHRTDKAKATGGVASKLTLEALFAKIQSGDVKELPVILKADVFGSVEAIQDSLVKLSTDKVKIKIILAAPGGVTESDVLLATASNAVIIGFNVRPETKARQVAEAEHVEIKSYSIIYELIDDVKKAMTGLLDKKKVERFLGRAEVRQIFTVPKVGTVAGSAVIDGKILRSANVRLLRDSRVIYDGKLASLRRFKDDAKEVATGFECGIGIENYNDLKPGDIIEAYQIDLVTPELGA